MDSFILQCFILHGEGGGGLVQQSVSMNRGMCQWAACMEQVKKLLWRQNLWWKSCGPLTCITYFITVLLAVNFIGVVGESIKWPSGSTLLCQCLDFHKDLDCVSCMQVHIAVFMTFFTQIRFVNVAVEEVFTPQSYITVLATLQASQLLVHTFYNDLRKFAKRSKHTKLQCVHFQSGYRTRLE